MVGFGGGSSYIAVLALMEFRYDLIPVIALLCNIIVVTGGSYHFIKQRHFNWNLFWPFMVSSIPLAYVGGLIPLSREFFLALLGGCLLLAGLRLLFIRDESYSQGSIKIPPRALGLTVGAFLGLFSGMVGIGGGIFLAPILLNFRWGKPKQVAATASVFILVNSVAGLTGQLVKQGGLNAEVISYWPLFFVVLIGGQLGSMMGSQKITQSFVKNLTGLLVLFVSGRLLFF